MASDDDTKGLRFRGRFFPPLDLKGTEHSEHAASAARLWVIGRLTNLDTDEKRNFNDAGELLSFWASGIEIN